MDLIERLVLAAERRAAAEERQADALEAMAIQTGAIMPEPDPQALELARWMARGRVA